MHLEFSEPVLVSMGPKSREAGWGPHQFARLDRLTDGRIMCSFLLARDSAADYGSDQGGFVSEDGGKTWKAGYDVEYRHLLGEKLPDGDFIGWIEPAGIPLEGSEIVTEHPGWRVDHIEHKVIMQYPVGTVHHKDLKDGYLFYRIDGKTGEVSHFLAKVENPYATVCMAEGVLVQPMPAIKHIRISPIDGSIWLPHYDFVRRPETGEFHQHDTNILLRSTDGGKSFQPVNLLFYEPEKYEAIDPRAHLREGFSENDIAWAPDGKTMVKLIRTDGYYPRTKHCQYNSSYITHSTDGGYTWEEPTIFDDRGVMPVLCTLPCGVTLATYGRPGCFVRASFDPEARVWEDRIEIVHSDGTPNDNENCVDVIATCAYSDFVILDDHTVGFAYSDFTQRDENGEMRKCIMYRTITVVED